MTNANKDKEQKLSLKHKLKKEAITIIGIFLIVFGLRSMFYEPYRIPSGSMIPTLLIGDLILVNKFAYGLRVPFSDYLNRSIYPFGQDDPQRGDVIVFHNPKDLDINFIKRVIGLPGDNIEIKNKILYINGQLVPMDNITKRPEGVGILGDMDEGYDIAELSLFKATMFKGPNEKSAQLSHYVMLDESQFILNDFSLPKVVPPDHFFVMGDNRDHSGDSRSWGFVPKNLIRGKAMLIWFSVIFPFSDYESKMRIHRIGKSID